MQEGLPTVAIGGMGGTIAMTPGTADGAVVPGLTAEELVAAVPELLSIADVAVEEICNLPSPEVGVSQIIKALNFARQAVRGGAVGVVITHGTDTLEESAFLLDLLWDEEAPIVITGAMRSATAAGAEGPANLLASVLTALSARSRGLGVLVCLNDTVHLASRVQKTSSMAVETFDSPGYGPVGRLVENKFRLLWALASPRPAVLPAPPDCAVNVALVECAYADDGRMIELVVQAGFSAIVVSAMGVGHVPQAVAEAVSGAIAAGVLVVVGSRTARSGTATGLYGYPGSETDLISRGAIMAGTLSPRKARLLLHILIGAGCDLQEIRTRFQEYSSP